jgi:hypothetical protein
MYTEVPGRLSLKIHSNEHVQSNNQWMLCAMESPRLRAGRGLSFGHLYRGDTGEVGTYYLGGLGVLGGVVRIHLSVTRTCIICD